MKMKLTILLVMVLVSQVLWGQKLHYELPDNANKMYSNGIFFKLKSFIENCIKSTKIILNLNSDLE